MILVFILKGCLTLNFFLISGKISHCSKKIKQDSLIKVGYLEILETREGEAVIIFLRGKKEDLEEIVLHLLINGDERNKLLSAVNSSYVEIKHMSFDKTARLLLAERLSGYGWTLKTSNFSCVTNSDMNIEFIYRDLWEK